MSKKLLLAVIAMSLLLGGVVFMVIKIQQKKSPQVATTNSENTFQAGWDAAKERLSQYPMGMSAPEGMEIKSVSGTIQKIEGDKLTVKINPLEPLADPDLDTRIITIDSNTKVTLSAQKDPAQFQKEMEEFQVRMKQSQENQELAQTTEPSMFPTPFEKKEIKVSDLKVGQQISVTANEDIKDKKEFIAVQIDVQEMLTTNFAPAPTPPTEIPSASTPTPTAPITPMASPSTPPAPMPSNSVIPAPTAPDSSSIGTPAPPISN